MHTLMPRFAGVLAGAIIAACATYLGYEVSEREAVALEAAITTFLTFLFGLATYAYTHRKASAKVNPADAATKPVAVGVAAAHDPVAVRARHGTAPDPTRRLP